MCGIFGIEGNVKDHIFKDALAVLSHRGPDNQSWYTSENINLGHVRLSILDLSEKSNQPLWDTEKRACIIFNGEIYNYKKLRSNLIEQGSTFTSEGDAEVILNLYLKEGYASLQKLRGMFAFAIWDAPKKELFIARDQFGIKPLYYAQNSEGFYFASEIKALLCIPSIKREININALYRSLVFLWSPGEETILKDIYKIKPGHFMVIKNKKIIEYTEYWKWPEYQPDFSTDIETHKTNILKNLKDAVSEQLVADVNVGAFLSGGLDSSLITALAQQQTNSPIECFTINSETKNNDGFSDDLPYAKQVSNHLHTNLNILNITPDITKLLPKMIYHLDELQADPAPINALLICEHAKEKNIKVLLSGAGGDDIFTGYRRHYAIKTEKYWNWLPKTGKKVLKKISARLPKKNSTLRRIAKAFQYADLSDNERLLSYFFWIDPIIAKELFINTDALDKNPFDFLYNEIEKIQTKDSIEKLLSLEQKYFLVDHNFNYTDKMSMAASVEVRVPFLDTRLVETASKIPSKYKQHGKIGKWILKKTAETLLPLNVIYRPKSGFGAPLRTWLKNELAPMVDTLLSEENIAKRGIFNSLKVKQLIANDRAGKEDYAYTIFALLCFEIWCQQFIDTRTPSCTPSSKTSQTA